MFVNLLAHVSYFLKDFAFFLVLLCVSFILLLFVFYKTYKSQTSQKRKKIIFSLLFTIFLAIFVFCCYEAYFRYIYDDSDGLGYLKTNARWLDRHVVYNNYFFRDRQFEFTKKEGVTRIGVLGDSLTFGSGIKDVNSRFSNLLEKQLIASGKNVEIYNLGRPGTPTEDQIAIYNTVKDLNFDVVVLEYYLNNAEPAANRQAAAILQGNILHSKFLKFMDNSFFFDFIYWRFTNKYAKTFSELKNADIASYHDAPNLQRHLSQLSTFIKDLKSENKKVVVIIFPFIHLLGPNYPARDIHAMLDDFFNSQSVETIDLLPDLITKNPKNLMASPFDAHPNESVDKLAAEKLFEVVAPFVSHAD